MEEDIEVLELDNSKKTVKKASSYNKPLPTRSENKKRKGRNKKTFIFQVVFCLTSFLFIIGCCIFYGSRLIKYYKIYNPKAEDGAKAKFLSSNISGKSEIVYEGSGIYKINGNYIYKGDVTNNYIKYNNLLWRIIKINSDDTMDIILDESINLINWDNKNVSFDKSNIYNYLNKEVVSNLNKDLLVKGTICNDTVSELNNITCDNTVSNYVKLMDISSFLNSYVNQKSYISSSDEIMWLVNYGEDVVWHTNGSSVSKSKGENYYAVRPVVTLKGTAIMYGGDGTKEKPYLVEKDTKTLNIGDSLSIGNDKWTVYKKENGIVKLSLNKVLDKSLPYSNNGFEYDINDDTTVAGYLNKTYYENLSYKKLLKEVSWNIGKYNGKSSDVTSDTVKAKVGLLNMADFKLNNNLSNYYLSSYNDEYVYVYGDILKESKPTIMRNILPCIALSDDVKINSGTGSMDDPYVVEVK